MRGCNRGCLVAVAVVLAVDALAFLALRAAVLALMR